MKIIIIKMNIKDWIPITYKQTAMRPPTTIKIIIRSSKITRICNKADSILLTPIISIMMLMKYSRMKLLLLSPINKI